MIAPRVEQREPGRRDVWQWTPNVVVLPATRRTVEPPAASVARLLGRAPMSAPVAYPCAGRAMRGADVETSYWARTGVRA